MSNNYIFPSKLATRMSLVKQKTLYESQMFGTSALIIGMILTGIYFWFYFDFALWYKIVLVINILAGMIVMGTSIITTYQQYLAFAAAIEFQRELDSTFDQQPEMDPIRVRRIRYIAAIVFFILGTSIFFLMFRYEWSSYVQIIAFILSCFCYYKSVTLVYYTNKFIESKMKGGIKGDGK